MLPEVAIYNIAKWPTLAEGSGVLSQRDGGDTSGTTGVEKHSLRIAQDLDPKTDTLLQPRTSVQKPP